MSRDPRGYLLRKRQEAADTELAQEWTELENYFNKRLASKSLINASTFIFRTTDVQLMASIDRAYIEICSAPKFPAGRTFGGIEDE